MVKDPPANAGDLGSIPGSGRSPGGGNGNPLVFLPGESHGQRSLAGSSPPGCERAGHDLATEQQHEWLSPSQRTSVFTCSPTQSSVCGDPGAEPRGLCRAVYAWLAFHGRFTSLAPSLTASVSLCSTPPCQRELPSPP